MAKELTKKDIKEKSKKVFARLDRLIDSQERKQQELAALGVQLKRLEKRVIALESR